MPDQNALFQLLQWYSKIAPTQCIKWQGPVGIKEDGGGCTRAQGRVGEMVIHRATCNRDKEGMITAPPVLARQRFTP